jgi:hypothetical protein
MEIRPFTHPTSPLSTHILYDSRDPRIHTPRAIYGKEQKIYNGPGKQKIGRDNKRKSERKRKPPDVLIYISLFFFLFYSGE